MALQIAMRVPLLRKMVALLAPPMAEAIVAVVAGGTLVRLLAAGGKTRPVVARPVVVVTGPGVVVRIPLMTTAVKTARRKERRSRLPSSPNMLLNGSVGGTTLST